jgi:hypothetical protein
MSTILNNIFGESISLYTRTQAIADGTLVDVSKIADEAGFKIPVAVTESIWSNFIEWTAPDSQRQTHQDSDGRLWDVLSMLRFAVAKAQDTDSLHYSLYVIPRDGKTKKAKLMQLKAIISAGDNGEPVITIMLPNED